MAKNIKKRQRRFQKIADDGSSRRRKYEKHGGILKHMGALDFLYKNSYLSYLSHGKHVCDHYFYVKPKLNTVIDEFTLPVTSNTHRISSNCLSKTKQKLECSEFHNESIDIQS